MDGAPYIPVPRLTFWRSCTSANGS